MTILAEKQLFYFAILPFSHIKLSKPAMMHLFALIRTEPRSDISAEHLSIFIYRFSQFIPTAVHFPIIHSCSGAKRVSIVVHPLPDCVETEILSFIA